MSGHGPAYQRSRYRIFASFGVLSVGFGLLLYARLTGSSLSPATWYIARSSGITLYLLLWLSVLFGLGMTTSALDRMWAEQRADKPVVPRAPLAGKRDEHRLRREPARPRHPVKQRAQEPAQVVEPPGV